MSIHIADKNDIPSLVYLMDVAYRGENSKQGWTSEADLFIGNKRTNDTIIEDLMDEPGTVFLKFLDEKGKPEACMMLKKNDTRLYLGMFSVSPAAQGKGIGKNMLAAADDHARQVQCKCIYMTVITVRTELIAWYEKHGYRKTGEVQPFPKDDRFGIPKQPLEMVVLEKWI